MFGFLLVYIFVTSVAAYQDYAGRQLEIYEQNHTGPPGVLTTSYGVPIDRKMAMSSLNTDLIRNTFFMDTIQSAVRERTPVRVVHSKGTGAFGYLEITDDISQYCRAKVFSIVGRKIPVVVRLSVSLSEKGAPDTLRETRGLAVKIYTEEGNFDIPCLSSPMYSYKDPVFFPAFGHIIQRNPATGLRDPNMFWDFMMARPESIAFFTYIFSDYGIPDGYIHMPAFNIHTLQMVNKDGEVSFVRFHFLPDAGIKNLTTEQAARLAGIDGDYATRQLYNAIASGDYPSWTLYGQFLSLQQVNEASFDPFDVTNILPIVDYPLKRIARLVLNKNPDNQFAQIEQLAFNPGNLPDGFVGGPGKLFESRVFTYRDSHIHRLGSNFNRINVNCPLHKANTYIRDGVPPLRDNGGDAPNYHTNTFGGFVPADIPNTPDVLKIYERGEAENFGQIKDFFEKDLTEDARGRLIQNIVLFLAGAAERLQNEAIKVFSKIHPELGKGIAMGLEAYKASQNKNNEL